MKKKFGLAATVVALAMVFMGCQPEVEHAHTFSTEWSFDKDSHWHDATCGHEEKTDLEPQKLAVNSRSYQQVASLRWSLANKFCFVRNAHIFTS